MQVGYNKIGDTAKTVRNRDMVRYRRPVGTRVRSIEIMALFNDIE